MTVSVEEIQKADLAKLHNEINQLRNHEFLACSFALGIVGTTIPELTHGPVVGLGILLVLLGLFFWHHTLIDTRSRLTSYLKATRRSQWELLYRRFADQERGFGQRTAGAVTFGLLGVLVPIVTFREGFAAFILRQPVDFFWRWIFAYGAIGLMYLAAVIYYGLVKTYGSRLIEYEGRWNDLLLSPDYPLDAPLSTPMSNNAVTADPVADREQQQASPVRNTENS
jgi:hypothetical protein